MPEHLRFVEEIEKHYGESEYRDATFYNDGMIQAVTFAYLVY